MHAASHGRINSLIIAIAAASLTGCGFGLSLPLIALNLETMTGSGALAGWNVVMSAVATILGAPLMLPILAKVPARGLLAAGCVICAGAFLAFRTTESLWAWAGIRFMLGVGITLVFLVSETWINQLADENHRGRLMGIYATALSAGFGLGGLLLSLTGVEGWLPFLAGAAIFASGAMLTALPGPGLVPPEGESARPRAMIAALLMAPTPLIAVLFFGAIETAAMNFIAVYGVRSGLGVTQAALFLLAGALGNIALQAPLGNLSDRIGAFRVLLICAGAGAVFPLLLWAGGSLAPLLYPLFFLYSGLVTGMYTIGLVMLGQRFKGGALAPANAAFVLMYGVGELVSPPASGAAMDWIDPGGLMLSLSIMASGFLAFAVIRRAATAKSR